MYTVHNIFFKLVCSVYSLLQRVLAPQIFFLERSLTTIVHIVVMVVIVKSAQLSTSQFGSSYDWSTASSSLRVSQAVWPDSHQVRAVRGKVPVFTFKLTSWPTLQGIKRFCWLAWMFSRSATHKNLNLQTALTKNIMTYYSLSKRFPKDFSKLANFAANHKFIVIWQKEAQFVEYFAEALRSAFVNCQFGGDINVRL